MVEDAAFSVDIYPSENVVTDFISLSKNGTLRIKAGYAWDGPSGPTIDTKSSMRGSLFHDALYQLLRMKLISGETNRRKADKGFYLILREDKMWILRAKICICIGYRLCRVEPDNLNDIRTGDIDFVV